MVANQVNSTGVTHAEGLQSGSSWGKILVLLYNPQQSFLCLKVKTPYTVLLNFITPDKNPNTRLSEKEVSGSRDHIVGFYLLFVCLLRW